MLFTKGTKIRLRRTGDEGVIRKILPKEDMVLVYLPGEDLEIPVFYDDVVRYEDFNENTVPAKFVRIQGPIEEEEEEELQPLDSQYFILKSQGIQLAFDPVYSADGLVDNYRVYLINDTQTPEIFSVQLTLQNQVAYQKHGQLGALSAEQIPSLFFDQLNEFPEFTVECRTLLTNGSGPARKNKIKIKPKQFFKRIKTAPLLNRPVHLYKVFEKDPQKQKKAVDKLQDYTRKQAQKIPKDPPRLVRYSPYDVEELAQFSAEIDLHIEALVDDPMGLAKSEILAIQLAHFDAFLEKAIRLGVDRFFAIHGIGKGRLKNAIAERLRFHPAVRDFKNEYHPKYGGGATEIFL